MPTTFILDENTKGYKNGMYENNIIRLKQYTRNLKTLLNYSILNEFDLIISDNSENKIIDKTIMSLIEKFKINFYNDSPNVLGKINKGAGIIENYKSKIEIIKNYNYVIHFEPRQILKNDNFLKIFIDKPYNRFKYSERHWSNLFLRKEFYTGMFSIKTDILLELIEKLDPIEVTKKKQNLEKLIYNFFKRNNYSFEVIRSLNLIWHNSYQKRDCFI